jgi:mono/diheme cytochrome c family protein
MKQWLKRAFCQSVFGVAVVAVTLVLPSVPARAFFHDAPDIDGGRTIYAAKCASCHGANLEGQPDWQSAKEDGTYPAPPHDETGHTWHHGDAMLRDYVRRGGQAVLDDMGVDFTSGMPGFGDDLTDDDIEAVLAYIRSTWPDRIRAAQSERSRLELGSP